MQPDIMIYISEQIASFATPKLSGHINLTKKYGLQRNYVGRLERRDVKVAGLSTVLPVIQALKSEGVSFEQYGI